MYSPKNCFKKIFVINNIHVPLIAPNGIFKPKILNFPVSITTTCDKPYSDTFSPNGFLSYKYCETNPNHPENQGL